METGHHMNEAAVDAAGSLTWNNTGSEDPGISSDNNYTLSNGEVYSAAGWTIRPTKDGTTFTNDGTGHGMFVSDSNANINTF